MLFKNLNRFLYYPIQQTFCTKLCYSATFLNSTYVLFSKFSIKTYAIQFISCRVLCYLTIFNRTRCYSAIFRQKTMTANFFQKNKINAIRNLFTENFANFVQKLKLFSNFLQKSMNFYRKLSYSSYFLQKTVVLLCNFSIKNYAIQNVSIFFYKNLCYS